MIRTRLAKERSQQNTSVETSKLKTGQATIALQKKPVGNRTYQSDTKLSVGFDKKP